MHLRPGSPPGLAESPIATASCPQTCRALGSPHATHIPDKRENHLMHRHVRHSLALAGIATALVSGQASACDIALPRGLKPDAKEKIPGWMAYRFAAEASASGHMLFSRLKQQGLPEKRAAGRLISPCPRCYISPLQPPDNRPEDGTAERQDLHSGGFRPGRNRLCLRGDHGLWHRQRARRGLPAPQCEGGRPVACIFRDPSGRGTRSHAGGGTLRRSSRP